MAFDPSKAKPWRTEGRDNFGAGWVHVVEDDAGIVAGFEEKEDAEKAVLAMAALDVMTRRAWTATLYKDEKSGERFVDGKWRVWTDLGWTEGFDDPFTALVEAVAWYVANVEKVN